MKSEFILDNSKGGQKLWTQIWATLFYLVTIIEQDNFSLILFFSSHQMLSNFVKFFAVLWTICSLFFPRAVSYPLKMWLLNSSKALVAGPLKKEFFCGFPCARLFIKRIVSQLELTRICIHFIHAYCLYSQVEVFSSIRKQE